MKEHNVIREKNLSLSFSNCLFVYVLGKWVVIFKFQNIFVFFSKLKIDFSGIILCPFLTLLVDNITNKIKTKNIGKHV